MMDYQKRYALASAPQARQDGSACIDHDIWAEAKNANDPDAEWFVVPGRHKTFSVPADDLSVALASGTNAQKVAAYKQALVENVNTQPEAIDGWGNTQLEALLDANDRAQEAAAAAQEFIAVVAPSGYPVRFAI